jgi:hypothetical protein
MLPTTTLFSQVEEHALQRKIDLASVDGRNRGRLAPVTATFTLIALK